VFADNVTQTSTDETLKLIIWSQMPGSAVLAILRNNTNRMWRYILWSSEKVSHVAVRTRGLKIHELWVRCTYDIVSSILVFSTGVCRGFPSYVGYIYSKPECTWHCESLPRCIIKYRVRNTMELSRRKLL
jgi:hypothetical protein